MKNVTLLSVPTNLSIAVPAAILLLMALIPGSTWAADPVDFDLPDGSGHFYRQANGRGGAGDTGYAITNDDSVLFWDEFRRLGGVQALGYPVSHRFVWDGFVVQAMQKVVFQWRPETGTVAFVNVLDRMHDLGHDDWLLAFRQTPEPFDTAPDANLTWDEVLQRHWAFLDTNEAIKARYWSDPAPLDHFGLPMSYQDMGNSFVVRAQRAVFQYWKEDVPWAKKGEVTLANSGDLAKEAGVFPVAGHHTPAPERRDRAPDIAGSVLWANSRLAFNRFRRGRRRADLRSWLRAHAFRRHKRAEPVVSPRARRNIEMDASETTFDGSACSPPATLLGRSGRPVMRRRLRMHCGHFSRASMPSTHTMIHRKRSTYW